MIIKFILAVIALTVIICNPILLFLVAGFGLAWLFLKHPNSFIQLATDLASAPKKEEDGLKVDVDQWAEKDIDPEIEADSKAESKMKPGYKDDKAWLEFTKRLGKQVQDAQRKEEQEARLQELTDEVI